MKLKSRLWMAFLSLGFLPLIITSALSLVLGMYQEHRIEKKYGVEAEGFQAISEPEIYFSRITDDIYNQLVSDSINAIEKFEDREYLEDMDNQLKELNSYLVTEKYGKVQYCRKNTELVSIMFGEDYFEGDFESYVEYWVKGVGLDNSSRVMIRKIEMTFPDTNKGHAYIITDFSKDVPPNEVIFFQVLIIAIILYIIISAIIIYRMYSDVSNPIRFLKEATQNVIDGYLDFKLSDISVAEMNELYSNFNVMIKELKIQAEEKLQYDKESKELISNISHDLKTPITAIKGYVEGIIDGVADTPERMERYIKTIYNKANDMDRLINELSFYSKIDTNRIPYTFTKINVNRYFNDCIEEKMLDLESKNIELAYFNYVAEDVLIIADAEQLKRVINNIIGNSIKYMDKEKGYINIRIKDVDDFIQVEIEDNGKGIGEKELPYIFERFYRTDSSRNSSTGGSGIGLSIVKKIIEDHGGKIWATSKESTGTVMYFMLRKYQEVSINE